MLQQDVPDDCVIATGRTHSIHQFLSVAFSVVGIDDWERYVVLDEKFLRPAEVDHLVGDSSKARRQLGWTPTVTFEELIQMMVESDIDEQTKLDAQRHAHQL